MKRVVILQEYVPTYRRPFFEALIRLGQENNIRIDIAAGQPTGKQSQRNDLATADFVTPLSQYELRFAGRRLVFRRTAHVIHGADLIILEQARRNLDTYQLLGRRSRPYQVGLWGHGKDYVKKSTRAERVLQRYLTKRSDWFFAYTELGAEEVRSFGFPSDKITVVRNSVDTVEIRSLARVITTADIASFRSLHGMTDNTAVFIGGLDETKRISFLLEAAAAAHKLDDTFRLLIVGDGPARHAVEDASGCSESVLYAGALLGRSKTLALLASKVIAMPGRVGLVAVDSFASGRPIVTTDWPWHAPEFEYLSPGANSVVAEDNDFAKELLSLMNDEPRLARMQNDCLSRSSEYTTDAMASRFFRGIAQALGEERSN